MASLVTGISGSVIAAILYDAAKGISRKFNDPFNRALEETSAYFSKTRGIEFSVDKLRGILEGNDAEIGKLKSGESFLDGDEFALQFAVFGDLYLENQSEILPIAKQIIDYFIEIFKNYILADPKMAPLLLREHIEKYGQLSHLEHSQIIASLLEVKSETQAIRAKVDGPDNINQDILKICLEIRNTNEKLSENTMVNPHDLKSAFLEPVYETEIDYARDLLRVCKPKEALNYLEKRKSFVWSTAQPIVKYRILTIMANAKLMLGIDNDAANLFIEALQHNPDDDKALCNVALGYFLLKQPEKSIVFVGKALEKNPRNATAYSVKIHLAVKDEAIEKVIETIPPELINTREVASTLSEIFNQNNDLPNAKRWLQVAVENDKDDLPQLKGLLGAITINLVLKDQAVIYANQLDEEQREQIEYAISILTAAWDRLSSADLKESRVDIIANRSFAKRIIGDIDGAIKDIENALDIEPTNPVFIKHRALMALHTEDNDKAIELFRGIAGNEETPEAAILLAELLRREHRFKESSESIEEVLSGNYPALIKEDASRLRIQLYIDIDELQMAKEASDILLAGDPKNILHMIVASNVANALGNRDDSISILNSAKSCIAESTSARELLELAYAFYFMEQFGDAVSIWERVLNKNVNTPHILMMLYSYYHLGQINKALEICQNLRQKYGPIKNISELESVIYEGIGDLPKAKEVCQQYLNTYHDDFGMKLRLAVVNYRLGNLAEVDKFLDSEIDLDTLTLEHGIQLAKLYTVRKQTRKALDAMYELRRKYINEADAHLNYVSIFLHREKDADEWLSVSKVEANTAVCIENDVEQQDWYIIEDRQEFDVSRKERNLAHPISQELMGQAIGHEVIQVKNPYDTRTGKIIDIKSKYVYAFQESLTSFEKNFPEKQGFYAMKFDKDKIFGLLNGNHDMQQKAEILYKGQGIPLGLFSKLIGKDILEVWSVRALRPDLGIKCCLGNDYERKRALSLLSGNPNLIVDVLSLMTLFSIDAKDIIVSAFGKLGVAQSTIDAINEIIEMKSIFQSDGCMTLAKRNDEYVRQEISSARMKDYIDYLNNILEWIRKNCDIVPVKAKLNLKLGEIKELDEAIGASFMDTVLIASEEGNILYSDDEPLRSLAKKDPGVDGVWTQAILTHCSNTGLLSKEEYCKMVIRLVTLNYYHTSIDADVILESAKQADWYPKEPYLSVIKLLNGNNSDESSALLVATQFLHNLLLLTILPPGYVNLFYALLDELTLFRNKVYIANKLKAALDSIFLLFPKERALIGRIIDTWRQTHII